MRSTILFFALIALLSCDQTNNQSAHRPIIMGDSATIVTETDSYYLQNMVMDVKAQPVEVPAESEKALVNADLDKAQNTNAELQQTASGFEINFGTFKAVFTGIEAIEFRTQDPAKDYSVSYKVMKGDLTKSQLIFSGVRDIEVTERYQSDLILEAAGDVLKLEKQGAFTSDWRTLKMNKTSQQFNTSLTSLAQLNYKPLSPAAIKKAVSDELRANRANQKTVQSWNKAISKVKSINDAPFKVVMNNAQWKISGTDSKGESFTKLIRMDGL